MVHHTTIVLYMFCFSFQLITVADSPHEDRIVALQMRPQSETSVFEKLAVTTAQDGKFKIWTLNAEEDEGIDKQIQLEGWPKEVYRPKITNYQMTSECNIDKICAT